MSAVADATAPAERTLANGLRVVAQPMPWTQAVTVQLVLPLGSVTDPEGTPGAAALLWEWLDRGAGGLSSREREEHFAALGLRHGGDAGRDRSGLWASGLGDVLPQALALLADEVAAPNLEDDELETARVHALDALASLEDQPAQRLTEALDAHAFRGPFARSAFGTEEGLESATPAALRDLHAARVTPRGALLAIAGGVEADRALDVAEAAFGAWGGGATHRAPVDRGTSSAAGAARGAEDDEREADPLLPEWAPPARHDLPLEAAQTQIGLAWPLLPPEDPRGAAQSLGLAVLSGGMGARLFREVREARGLAYAVSASAAGVRGAAWGTAYAGTRPERAEETLRVLREELLRLAHGVEEDELARARILLRTREATRGESSGGRCGQLVQDLVLRGRARSAAERLASLERPRRTQVNEALAAAPARTPTVVVMGPADVDGSRRAADAADDAPADGAPRGEGTTR